MPSSDDNIIQELVKLNMRIEYYFEQLAENHKEADGGITEQAVFQIFNYFKDKGYIIKSSFYNYLFKHVKELYLIQRQQASSRGINNPFRTMRNKYREIMIKRDIQTYLETCEVGVNFTFKSGKEKIIYFKPSLSVITNIKIMIYEDYGI